MKTEKAYRAVSIKIGIIAGSKGEYYLDVISMNGNQQTAYTGNLEYVKACISKIIFI